MRYMMLIYSNEEIILISEQLTMIFECRIISSISEANLMRFPFRKSVLPFE